MVEMVMSEGHERGRVWNVAEAKAKLSRLLEDAGAEPQVVANRGEEVAVVVGVKAYETLVEQAAAGSRERRWKRFLQAGAELRKAGGGELRIPPRRSRRAPGLGG